MNPHLPRWLRSVWASLTLAAGLAGPASAAPVLSVGGTATNSIEILAGDAVAVSFQLGAARSGLTINADLLCVACDGRVYLMQHTFGATANAGDLLVAAAWSGSGPLLSGLDLVADDYYLVLTNLSGSLSWFGGAPFDVVGAADAVHGDDFRASAFDATFPPSSTFELITGLGARFYSVNAAPHPLSAPATAALVTVGVLGVAATRQRRTRQPASLRSPRG